MNKLIKLKILKNKYFVMRHGQSLANCEGLVVSKPENGIASYGLSDEGRLQVNRNIKQNDELDNTLLIISSDFKRAHESANIAHQLLGCERPLLLEPKLRERDFGDYELGPDTNYHKTWANDAMDSSHTINNVESADSVMIRVTTLVASLETQTENVTYLLVAHGDTLQVLQTAFQKRCASKQRELPHLETAEIRELKLKV